VSREDRGVAFVGGGGGRRGKPAVELGTDLGGLAMEGKLDLKKGGG